MYHDTRSEKQEKGQIRNKLEGDTLYRKIRKIVGKDKSRDFFENWVWATSCPQLELSYQYNKRHNSIDLVMK